MTSNPQLYLFATDSNITYTYRYVCIGSPAKKLPATGCWHRACPTRSIAKVARSQIYLNRRLHGLWKKEGKDPIKAWQSRAGSLEEEQTRFPAWLGWRAGGKEEERRYFHCLQQNRNSSSQRRRGRGLKRRNDIPPASRVHLQLVFEKHFHKYLP